MGTVVGALALVCANGPFELTGAGMAGGEGFGDVGLVGERERGARLGVGDRAGDEQLGDAGREADELEATGDRWLAEPDGGSDLGSGHAEVTQALQRVGLLHRVEVDACQVLGGHRGGTFA